MDTKTTKNTKITNTQNQAVSTSFTQEKIELIKKHFFPNNATIVEMEYCLNIANKYNLDPFLRQIFFVPRRAQVKINDKKEWVDKIEPLVGRDGFLAIAHKTGKFGGIRSYSEIKQFPRLNNGKWEYIQDLVAVCEVYRTDSDKPFVVEVAYNEYVQKRETGEATSFWTTKPDTMLKKVAESQALRKAFNLSGLYSAEEMGVGMTESDNIIIDVEAYQTNTQENKKKVDFSQNFSQSTATTFSEDERQVLLSLGLEVKNENNYYWIVGNTYGLTDKLKKLGYKYHPDKKTWWKQIENVA
ncbi:phage recombination protein Bet [Campylobacter coli]|uniref:Phage recombination protein Bet n=1 Tax=Campylobacter coli TaxID=195 RepID=A0A692K4K8_CAMCO|nr:phage recombination protein Bet [Campylobacter coli]ECL3466008.1 phage recombination protein Bet [Campylobacter jejuni]HEE6703191.1 phage recombination protein Bet [Campylobacter jejuni subsp. jejuni]ALU99767.1 RecT family protein [Campylobacter coli]ALU99980.1 RecT family protein [Campylobacter coli]EAC1804624.1 phage recombination protein Bet [Campylobacter coli]